MTTVERGRTYIFTIPPKSPQRNCSGPVVAIEYCHISRKTTGNARVFTIFILSFDGITFTIESESLVRYRLSGRACSSINSDPSVSVCCNRQNLNDMMLPGANITFGIVQTGFELLTFSSSTTEYDFPQLQGMLGNFRGTRERTNFTLMELDDKVDDQSLLLLRFFINSQGSYVRINKYSFNLIHFLAGGSSPGSTRV